jgi:hypothetical protein
VIEVPASKGLASAAIEMETVGTARIVIAIDPEVSPTVAVICATPGDTAVTAPLELTVATASLLDVHTAVLPTITLPLALSGRAPS